MQLKFGVGAIYVYLSYHRIIFDLFIFCVFKVFPNNFGVKISKIQKDKMNISNCLFKKKAMIKNDNVKTAIRWRPPTENREIIIEKLANDVNIAKTIV